ncbi:hypothetical protein M5D96_009224 [Drosophila gunungcola]|uniref:Uncharacterized protein n=1 Tax=Drosophila gunungcola TaxID=103775 RepID=A0A9P9YJE5_9MUSC|nr:hypothetical protein M5D96_009224 [Drosophila gunungcola]
MGTYLSYLFRSPGLNLNVAPPQSPLPGPNSNPPTSNNNLMGRLSYAPLSPPMVNYSTVQPIMLPSDFTLQAPTSSLHSSTANNNNNSDNNLPSLARLDWPTMQKPKRVHARHH